MRTNYFIQLIIASILLFNVNAKAQSSIFMKVGKSINNSKEIQLEKKNGFINLKSLKAHFENYKTTKKYNPSCSVNVLNGKGIYLFSFPSISSIPTIRVGVDVKVGLTITL